MAMFYSFDEINDALAAQAEAFAIQLFGEPIRRSAKVWEWKGGQKLKLTRRGEWRGWFTDWRAHRWYRPIAAAALALGMSHPDAAHWCAVEFLRWPDLSGRTLTAAEKAKHEQARAIAERERRQRQTEAEALEAAEEAQKIEEVVALWRRGVPIKGTPAEVYLRGRSIEAEAWPSTLRWHPAKRCLLALSTSPEGNATALQEIHLDDDGTPRRREDGSKIKISRGPRREGAVRFSGSDDGPLVICEGVETGLSVWVATGFEVWVGLGLISGVSVEAVPHDRTILACPDDDPRGHQTIQAANKAIKRWRAEGRTVLVATPYETLQRDKSDHNDALMKCGKDHVAARFRQVLGATPKRNEAMVSVEEARGELAAIIPAAIKRLSDEAIRFSQEGYTADNATQLGVRVSVGGGKTQVSTEALVSAVKDLRRELGEAVPALVYAVPTHRLGAELERRIAAEGERQGVALRVQTWRGREATEPVTGEKMCLDIQAVKAAQKAMLRPQETVCQSPKGNCPFFSKCGYQQQRKASADIWIVPHASLFHERPETIGQPALLVVDEGLWQSSLRGFDKQKVVVGLASLGKSPSVLTANTVGDAVLDPFGTADLDAARKQLLAVVRDSGHGPIKTSALLDAGVTADLCKKAATLEWKRLRTGGLVPGMDSASFLRKAKELADGQGDVSKMATMWRLLSEALDDGLEACGRVSFEVVKDTDGIEHEALVLRWTAGIAAGWNAPLLHVDATLRPSLVQHIFPRLEVVADIQIETPHQNTIGVVGKSFSHSALSDEKSVLRMWRAILCRATLVKGETLVVMPQRAEDIIRNAATVPPHVYILHHNATTGLDSFGKVDLLIVVGRTLPPPDTVSKMAAAITGKPTNGIGTADGWYSVEMATVAAKDGTAVTLSRERHAPGLPEEIRAAICSDQLVQAIGRGRGVNRTSVDPLTVEIWSDSEPPMAVDSLRQFEDPTRDQQALANGLWVENAADLSALYPELGSEAAIKQNRLRKVSNSNNDTYWNVIPTSNGKDTTDPARSILRSYPHLRAAIYRKAGAGTKPKMAVWDTRVCADPQARLLGALKLAGLDSWQEIGTPPEAALEPLGRPQEPVPEVVGDLVFISREGSDETPLRLQNGRPLIVGVWEIDGFLNPEFKPLSGDGAVFRRNGDDVDMFVPDGPPIKAAPVLPGLRVALMA